MAQLERQICSSVWVQQRVVQAVVDAKVGPVAAAVVVGHGCEDGMVREKKESY